MNLGIEKFIEELSKINGKHVKIDIVHKLYGNQTIEYDLCILNDKGRLGFYINEQDVQYIGEQLKEIYRNLLMEEQEDDRY